MSFSVHELLKAKQDKESIFRWLHGRSPKGAVAWLRAYDSLLDRLRETAPSFAECLESKDCEIPIRQALFKTRRGRVYRAVFMIEGEDVYILRIRGAGADSS